MNAVASVARNTNAINANGMVKSSANLVNAVNAVNVTELTDLIAIVIAMSVTETPPNQTQAKSTISLKISRRCWKGRKKRQALRSRL
jgi:hypothetical protein